MYGVATVSRVDKNIGLFCRIASLLECLFAKETYNLIDPTNQSHPISVSKVCHSSNTLYYICPKHDCYCVRRVVAHFKMLLHSMILCRPAVACTRTHHARAHTHTLSFLHTHRHTHRHTRTRTHTLSLSLSLLFSLSQTRTQTHAQTHTPTSTSTHHTLTYILLLSMS